MSFKGVKNIGPTIEKRLNEIGVFSLSQLQALTPVEAYNMIKLKHPGKTIPVCYYLYSLQGALMDLHWNDVPEDIKRKLTGQI